MIDENAMEEVGMQTTQGIQGTPGTTKDRGVIVSGVATVALLANLAGYFGRLYARFWWFDKALHAYTLFAMTLTAALLAYRRGLNRLQDHRFLQILTISSFGLAIGALWEVIEWAYDHLVAGNVIQGKLDTITDLIMDTIGAVAAGFVAVRILDK
jgi:uncharacterized membrane protein YjdF